LLPPGTPIYGLAPAGYTGHEASPDAPIAESHHRPPVRRELRERLKSEMEVRKRAHEDHLREFEFVNDPYYRNTMVAPEHRQASLMLRSEDSNFRKVERLNAMLAKLRTGNAQTPSPNPAAYTQNEGTTHDVDENKGP